MNAQKAASSEELQVGNPQFSTCNTQRDATRCTTVQGNTTTPATHPFRGVAVLQSGGVALTTNPQIFTTRPATQTGKGTLHFSASWEGYMVSVTRRKHRRVGVNDRGRPVGESHPLAKLSDADIELIHELREAGLSYAQIAAKFDDGVSVSKGHVRDILTGRRRGQMPVRFKVKPCA